ncbi:uncharacterized protein LOC110715268 [Chenopodium quinoa]|uniref:uncharacterized protein LOC110715268 n=1 Tax=Chenopodium quinoa TaxID=63459 RepID=UPI000B78720D|nr:uncharacterized protein LOC110715268 [Chenopodium quinoa]
MARKPASSSSSATMREHRFRPTTMTMSTLSRLGARGHERITGTDPNGTVSFIHDMSSPSYRWLLPGWLAEERILANGRVYKYYYDPKGNQYNTKYEVLYHWSKQGMVVLDV